jgi:hypothetical protein
MTVKLAIFTLPLLLAGLASASPRTAEEPVIFSDDFSELRPGWGKSDESRSVSDHKLLLKLEPEILIHPLYDGEHVGNADIRLKVEQRQGNTDQLGGIAFWATGHENYYAFGISSEGRFATLRRMNNKELRPGLMGPAAEIKLGIGQVNELRVVTSGRLATVYVNDKQIAEFQGFPPQGKCMFGVYAESGADPATWAFSDLSVRNGPPSPVADKAADETILLADNFKALDPMWGPSSESQRVEDQKLLMTVAPDKSRSVLYCGSMFENADIRLKIAETNGATDQLAGIVFWASDKDNCYAAVLTADGAFSVDRRMRSKWLTPVSLRESNDVHKGLGQTNELRVVTCGPTAAVYINEQQQISFQGYPPAGACRFGVRAEAGTEAATWAFSELCVRQGPAPSSTNAAPADDALLLADDFVRLEPAWGLASETKYVRDNRLCINLKPEKTGVFMHQATLFDDVDMSVKVAAADGWTDQLPGLVFWANDYKDYCAFVINPEGDIYSGRILEGKWKGMNILKNNKRVMRARAGEANELRVATSGNSATLYINGQKMYTYKGTPPEGGSRIGLRVETNEAPAACEFTELRVRKPSLPAENRSENKSTGNKFAGTDGLLLADDFTEMPSIWGSPDEFQSISNHQLLLTPKPATVRTNNYLADFGNIDVRVKVAQVNGDPKCRGGVMFWVTKAGDYYAACYSSDGHFCVLRRTEGTFVEHVPWRSREELRRGSGESNDLRVVTSGRTAEVFVNNQQIASLRGFPPKGGGGVGLFAESGREKSTWAFSELSVRKGPASPDDKIAADDAMIFTDNFQTIDPAWIGSTNCLSVSDNKLILTPKANTGAVTMYSACLLKEADIRVKIAQIVGGTEAPAGLVFWASDKGNGFFLAKIRSDGLFDVLKNFGGKTESLAGSKVLDSVVKGKGQVNELRVVTKGKKATVYVNDQPAASVENDALPEFGSKIGLFGGATAEPYSWSFSDLIVRKPK